MSTLRFMSFNIRHGRARDPVHRWPLRRELVYEVIARAAPHVLGLQEANEEQLEDLSAALPDFGTIAGLRYGGRMGVHAAVMFDQQRLELGTSGGFWLSHDPSAYPGPAWDADMTRTCTWAGLADRTDGRRFAVWNTHLDQGGAVARTESARLLLSRLDELAEEPRVVLGDFNAAAGTPELRSLVAGGLRDTFAIVHPGATAVTYHGFRDTRRVGRIDFILCDARWDIRDAAVETEEVGGRLASDHHPVTAELSMASSPSGG